MFLKSMANMDLWILWILILSGGNFVHIKLVSVTHHSKSLEDIRQKYMYLLMYLTLLPINIATTLVVLSCYINWCHVKHNRSSSNNSKTWEHNRSLLVLNYFWQLLAHLIRCRDCKDNTSCLSGISWCNTIIKIQNMHSAKWFLFDNRLGYKAASGTSTSEVLPSAQDIPELPDD